MRRQWLIAVAMVILVAGGLWYLDARQGTVSHGDDGRCAPVNAPDDPATTIVVCRD